MKQPFLNVRIDPELREALTRHFEATGVRTGEFVRRTLRAALAGTMPVVEYRDLAQEQWLRDAKTLLITRREGTNDADPS